MNRYISHAFLVLLIALHTLLVCQCLYMNLYPTSGEELMVWSLFLLTCFPLSILAVPLLNFITDVILPTTSYPRIWSFTYIPAIIFSITGILNIIFVYWLCCQVIQGQFWRRK